MCVGLPVSANKLKVSESPAETAVVDRSAMLEMVARVPALSEKPEVLIELVEEGRTELAEETFQSFMVAVPASAVSVAFERVQAKLMEGI